MPRFNLISIVFIFIGILIGIILSLQIRANPVSPGSSPLEQIKIQKNLLDSFSLEQQELKQKLDAVEIKISESQKNIEKRSEPKVLKSLDILKGITGFKPVKGIGIRIILNDNPSASRTDFSPTNENFAQAVDLRDLINLLFLKDAQAVSINGKRITPFISIQSVFDSILVGNYQISPPFIIEAIGGTEALSSAVKQFNKRKLQLFTDESVTLDIKPMDALPSLQFLTEA